MIKNLILLQRSNLDNKNYSRDLFKKIKRIQTITESSASGINDFMWETISNGWKDVEGHRKDTYGIYSNGMYKA
jgi:hypothetical protein